MGTEHIGKIKQLAEKYNWEFKLHDQQSRLLHFKKSTTTHGMMTLNVYYTTMTVGTYLTHPVSGKTSLFRRDVNLYWLERLFKYPRQHTKIYLKHPKNKFIKHKKPKTKSRKSRGKDRR